MIGVGGSVWTPVINRPISAPSIAKRPTTTATSISHGDVTFTLDSAFEVGNYVDGPAFVVMPSGSADMSEPTPAQSTIDSELVNGAMFIPTAVQATGFDARPDAAGTFGSNYHITSVHQTWPQEVTAGNIFLKGVSSNDASLDLAVPNSFRRGPIASYGACIIVSEVPPIDALSPSIVGWTGRGTPQHHRIDIAAKVAALPSYPSAGQDFPTYANLIARINKFNPVLPLFGENPASHRIYAPKGLGRDSDQYGLYVAGNLQAAQLALVSDAYSTAEKETIATALCSMGIQFFDAFEGEGVEQKPNGGLYQYAFPLMALALDWRGDSAKLATLRTEYGGNFRQAFEITSSHAAQFAPHDSVTQAHTWRRRNLDAISGTTFTIETYRVGSEGDNTKGSFNGLFLTNGTVSTLVTGVESGDNIDSSATGQFNINVTSATGFSVDDTVWFEPYATMTEGASEWVIEGTDFFNQYSPVSAGYRNLNQWAGAVLFLKAAGIWHAEWDPVAAYVRGANEENYPSSGYDWPNHFNEFYGPSDAAQGFEADFWADHADTILTGVTNIPAQMSEPVITISSATVFSADRQGAPASPGASITQYDLRYSTDEATWTTVTDISDPETVTVADTTVEYFFQTRAVNSAGNGPWSASKSSQFVVSVTYLADWRADTGVTTSGTDVTLWEDQSGNGLDLVTHGGGDDAQLSTLNSNDVIDFPHTANEEVMIASGQGPAVGSPKAITVIFAGTIEDAEPGSFAARIISERSSGGLQIFTEDTNSVAFYWNGSTHLGKKSADSAFTTGVPLVIAFRWQGTTSASGVEIFINGVEPAYAISQNGSNLATSTEDVAVAGTPSYNADFAAEIKVGRLQVIDGAISDSDLNVLAGEAATYVGATWTDIT